MEHAQRRGAGDRFPGSPDQGLPRKLSETRRARCDPLTPCGETWPGEDGPACRRASRRLPDSLSIAIERERDIAVVAERRLGCGRQEVELEIEDLRADRQARPT